MQTSKKPPKKAAGGKNKLIEKEFEVKPLPGPSTDFLGAGSAFRPGVKRAADTTPSTTPSKREYTCAKGLGRFSRGGDVAQWVEHQVRHAADVGLTFRTARDFPPRVNFRCRLSSRLSSALACFNVCAPI